MAQMHFAGGDDYSMMSGAAGGQRLINLIGAAVSVALVVGLCLWGYRLAVRDVTGVPVVRALEGPMRVAPDQPGGEVMAHQGLAVNEVAEDGVAAGLAERLVLAPRPVDLAAEDAPGAFAAPGAQTSARAATTPGLTIAATAEEAPQDTATLINAVVSAVVDGEGAGIEDLSGGLDAPAVLTPAALPPVALPGRVAGPALRPQPRPSRLVAIAAPAAPAGLPEIDPATLAVGTRLVQLGAFETVEEARAEWDRLYTRFGDLLRDKARVVEAAQSGGRAFYRLRAHGFAGEEDARRFCSALMAEDTACVAVAQR